ncbi:sugar transferase [Qipengyuania soli]|uniref:sugar transferase n=1 Tax=Qipengyuania soli TaxID=2782568 RepID=UPI0031B5C50E
MGDAGIAVRAEAGHRNWTIEMLNQMRISNEREFEIALLDSDLDEVDSDGRLIVGASAKPMMFADGQMGAMDRTLVTSRPAVQPLPGSRSGNFGDLVMRAVDIVAAAAMIVLFMPVMAIIWVALRLFEKGPAIFAHERIGRDLAPFPCLKFRTMCVDADARLEALLSSDEMLKREWTATQKLLCDPRVTRLGRFLRNTSLDELPQLFNVLRGDMSLVGPRPIVANEVRRYGRHALDYASVRPGLTGLWQVTRDETTSYRRRVATDVFYVRNRGIGFDCRILLATIPAVLGGNG